MPTLYKKNFMEFWSLQNIVSAGKLSGPIAARDVRNGVNVSFQTPIPGQHFQFLANLQGVNLWPQNVWVKNNIFSIRIPRST